MADRLLMDALLLAKVESTSGTDATPVQGSDAIRILEPLDPKVAYLTTTPRDKLVRGTKRNAAAGLTPKGRYGTWSTKVLARGNRTTIAYASNVVPESDPFWQAAGWVGAGSFGAGTEKWVYNCASSSLKTLTAYYYSGGRLRKLLGARADLTASFKAGGPLELAIQMTGVYQDTADTSTPGSPTFGTATEPVAESATVSFAGFATGIVRECSVSTGNTIQQRPSANAVQGIAYPFIPFARPTFKLVLEDPLVADVDLEMLQKNATKNAFSWQVGTVQYNRIKFASSGAVIEQYEIGSDNGIPIVTLTGVLADSTDTANDAAQFTFD